MPGCLETWATADSCLCVDQGVPVDVVHQALPLATDLLWRASGRQFNGVCTSTVRPCAEGGARLQYLAYNQGQGSRIITPLGDGRWLGGSCHGLCTCGGADALRLEGWPIVGVTQVKVDGVALAATEYRVVDRIYLVRNGATFPCTQDLSLPDTEPGTWAAVYEWGQMPPPGASTIAGVLACEIARAWTGDDHCRLPTNVAALVREGVSLTMLDPSAFLNAAGGRGPVRFGLWEVDTWLGAINPAGLVTPGKVIRPKSRRTHQSR